MKTQFNVTSIRQGWKSESGVIIRIESLVAAGFILMLIQLICGIYRRKSNHWLVRILLFLTYASTYSFATYVIGMMQSSAMEHPLFAVWTVCLLSVYAGTNTVSAYSLEDNENWKGYAFRCMVLAFAAGGIIGTYMWVPDFRVPLLLMFTTVCYRIDLRGVSFRLARMTGNTFFQESKVISDHMSREHQYTQLPEKVNLPSGMHEYHYLIEAGGYTKKVEDGHYMIHVDIKANDVVTTAKVWTCEGRFLRRQGDPSGKIKDLCLSFALFRMLLRRFSGYPFAESCQEKTKDLVFNVLLSKNDDHERAFRVVEAELNFLYDYFYTRYPLIYIIQTISLIVSLIIIGSAIWLASTLLPYFHLIHIKVTVVFVVLLVILEIAHIATYLVSDWAKISFVCKYVVNSSWHDKCWIECMLGLLCRLNCGIHWKNRLGQYSLLQNFGYRPKFSALLHCLSCRLIDKNNNGQKELPSVKVPKSVKNKIISTLKISNGVLKNGILSLENNRMLSTDLNLSWACSFPSDTVTILVWHVATTLCEIETTTRSNLQPHPTITELITVATCLSKYCGYLVAFVPELLPGNRYDNKYIFNCFVKEAVEVLKTTPQENIYDTLMGHTVIPESMMICKGVDLAKILIQLHELRRWNLLAEFWSEMILYVAPSENATDHLKKLAEGGEFLTQLWALLSHAGILVRASNH